MSHVMNTYARLPVAFVRGEGVWLWDQSGKKYLDGLAGIAVNTLGYGHPGLSKALNARIASGIVHTSNLFQIPDQEAAADRIAEITGLDEVFFCNSGCEANEAAIKVARLYGHKRGVERPEIIVFEKAFHGRTLATLSATGSRKVQAGFEPLVSGFVRVPLDDLDAVRSVAAHNKNVVAVLIEPIQGEGGIHVSRMEYLRGLKEICDKNEWLFMADEVQCGLGRTGQWFVYQHAGISPDVVPLAKGLGGGVAVGACVTGNRARGVFSPGKHGSTFGGNPLACTAVVATIDTMKKEKLLENATRVGRVIRDGLAQGLAGTAGFVEVRGMGMMLGVELDRPCGDIVAMSLEAGLVLNVTADNVVRLLPPLVMSEAEGRQLVDLLVPVVKAFLCAPGGGPGFRIGQGGGLSMPQANPIRHFLQFRDLSREELYRLFDRTRWIKDKFKRYERFWPLEDRTLVMIFEKQSTRTRLSFEAGMHQLGGAAIFLSTRDSQLGRGEPVEDAAQVISRMCDLVMIRTFEQDIVERFAGNSRVPVINGLTNEYHPCQILADIYTYIEQRGDIKGKTVAWIGDSNNVCNTWLQAAEVLDFNVHVSTPPGYEVEPERANLHGTRHYEEFTDPMEAARGADLVTTDVWTSMGFEAENDARKKDFGDWQVDAEMMKVAGKGAVFMHCLPAHRGEEVSADVIDGPQSVVWDEAENRLHTQKALMEFLLQGKVKP